MRNLFQRSLRVLSMTMLMALALLPLTAFAATTTISDQASCEAAGGSWDGNCTFNGYSVASGDTITYTGSFYVYVDGSMTVNSGGTLNANGSRFRNYAPVTNAGTINVNGFEFGLARPSTNTASGKIIVRGNLYVADTLTNQGTITVLCGGQIAYLGGTITGNPPQYADCTAPSASPTQTPAANANGWNNSNVTVNWNWTDNTGGSGIDNANCTISTPSTGEGILTLNATCKDRSGNTGSATYQVKVDKTAPTLTCQQPAPSFSVNQANASVSATVTDALSGPASSPVSQNVDTSTPGSYTVTLTGSDLAGNTSSVNCGYTVNKAEQTITFPQPADHTYGDAPFDLNATASSGLTVSYTSNDPSNCTVSGKTVTIVRFGSCFITASQDGNASYSAATPVTQFLGVRQATPTVIVTGGTFPYDGNPHPATVTVKGVGGESVAGGLTIRYNPGDSNAPVNPGTYGVTAIFDPGDPNYTSRPIMSTSSITITKVDQTITLSGVPATATFNTTFTPSASASSSLPVTISVSGVCSLNNGVVTITSGTGSCVVTASQDGNDNYNPVSTNQTVTVQKASQTITFNTPTFNYFPYPSGNNTFGVGATASSSLPVSFGASGSCSVSGTTVTVTGVGACVITATQSGDTNYSPATPVSRTFQVVPNPTGYNLLSLGNLTMTSTSTDGLVGVLGNASFQGTNLATANTGSNAVQVQGNVSFGNWGNQVNGNVVYSGNPLNKYVTFSRGGFVQNSNALPLALRNYTQGVSAAWATLTANGTVDYKSWGQIILTGNNTSQNVFSVDGSKLSAANSLVINAPAGSSVILNISGTTDSLRNMGIQLNGPTAAKVVYNFYQATSLTLTGVRVDGTIWATTAAVTSSSLNVNGTVVAGSVSDSSSSYHNTPLTVSLPAVQ